MYQKTLSTRISKKDDLAKEILSPVCNWRRNHSLGQDSSEIIKWKTHSLPSLAHCLDNFSFSFYYISVKDCDVQKNIFHANLPAFRNLSESGTPLAKIWSTRYFSAKKTELCFSPYLILSNLTLLCYVDIPTGEKHSNLSDPKDR